MFSNQFSERILSNYAIRRLAVDYGVPLITNIQVSNLTISPSHPLTLNPKP